MHMLMLARLLIVGLLILQPLQALAQALSWRQSPGFAPGLVRQRGIAFMLERLEPEHAPGQRAHSTKTIAADHSRRVEKIRPSLRWPLNVMDERIAGFGLQSKQCRRLSGIGSWHKRERPLHYRIPPRLRWQSVGPVVWGGRFPGG